MVVHGLLRETVDWTISLVNQMVCYRYYYVHTDNEFTASERVNWQGFKAGADQRTVRLECNKCDFYFK